MRLLVRKDAAAAAELAAALLADAVRADARAVLGLATGGTMEPVYRALVRAHRVGLSFAGVTTFNLDEYVGLPPDHPQSSRRYMQRHLFDRADFDPGRTHVPRGDIAADRASAAYEALLADRGPVGLQLLGLGRNGHIGFNEPGSAHDSRTREVRLSDSTLEANSRFFGAGERPPRTAVTMGIGTILDARAIVVLAVGDSKAEAARDMLCGPRDAGCPASALQRHDDVTVILDAAAARLLPQAGTARAGA